MEPIREHFKQQQAPVAGIAKDLRRAKTEGAASAAELRQFMGQLQGRSPQEVMGVVAQSNLFRSILLATAGSAVLLVALTIIPYVLSDPTATTATAPPAPAPAKAAPTDDPSPEAAGATTPDNAAGGTSQPDLQRAANAMGIGDAAAPDSDTKPLDDKLDKLLDGID